MTQQLINKSSQGSRAKQKSAPKFDRKYRPRLGRNGGFSSEVWWKMQNMGIVECIFKVTWSVMCFSENDDRPGQICAGIRLRIYGGNDFMGEMISLRQGQSLVEAVTSANATRAMVKTWPRGWSSIGVHSHHNHQQKSMAWDNHTPTYSPTQLDRWYGRYGMEMYGVGWDGHKMDISLPRCLAAKNHARCVSTVHPCCPGKPLQRGSKAMD